MDNSPEAARIIAKAHKWTFDEDCELLKWMQQISENLENRASSTLRGLETLNTSVNRTCIGLENVSNSLTALQYTQFVESRVAPDDASKPTTDADTTDAAPTQQSTSELLKTFLQNNIKMLHNCHEKYALDLDDSDDEQTPNNNNCIYQPKNPYNDRPLPHIYGTQLWREHWHVGLSEGGNDYSDDEPTSEAFSETSSSGGDSVSATDTNSANMSTWASQASIGNAKLSLHVKNASSLHGSTDECAESRQPSLLDVVGSDVETAATDNRHAVPQQRREQHDLFAPLLRNSPPTMAPPEPRASTNHETAAATQRSVDLFSDVVTTAPTTAQAEVSSQRPSTLCKPVNLFDDDDFNSLMSEIKDKATVRAAAPVTKPPTAAPRQAVRLLPGTAAVPPVLPVSQPKQLPKTSPLNLFDSPEHSPPRDTFRPPTAVAAAPLEQTTAAPKTATNTRITPKSLFDDDDDDDDDFLNLFGNRNKKPTKSQPTTTVKSLFFEDDEGATDGGVQSTAASKAVAGMASKVNIFADDQDLFGSLDAAKATEESRVTKEITRNAVATTAPLNLFADTKDNDSRDLFGSTSAAKSIEDLPQATVAASNRNKEARDLFAEADDDEQSGLFAGKEVDAALAASEAQPAAPPATTAEKAPPEQRRLFAANLFNEAEEDEEGDLFAPPPTLATASEPPVEERSTPATGATQQRPTAPSAEPAAPVLLKETPPAAAAAPASTLGPTEALRAPGGNYANLFLAETPPDDDDFFQSLSGRGAPLARLVDDNYEEPPLPHAPSTQSAESSSKVAAGGDYAGLQLFSDVPPDDDDAGAAAVRAPSPAPLANESSKNLQHVFYDDFLETMEALKQPSELKIHSLFDSEPPPDECDDDRQLLKATDAATTEKASAVVAPPKRSESKLPKLNINVQALLPPSAAKSAARPAAAALDAARATVASAPDDGKLSSMCKTRVRVPATRRPSTRRGRQQRYEQTLSEERSATNSEERSTASSEERSAANSEERSPEQAPNTGGLTTAAGSSRHEPSRTTVVSGRKDIANLFRDASDDERAEPATVPPPVASKAMTDELATLFAATRVSARPAAPLQVEHTTPAAAKEIVAAASNETTTTARRMTGATQLFGADDESDGDDWFSTKSRPDRGAADQKAATAVAHPKTRAKTTREAKPKAPNKTFLDESCSDSDEDLFKSVQTKAGGKTAIKGAAAVAATPLFGSDDDEDGADFLSALKPAAKAKAQQSAQAAASSLFSDDDDDALFSSKAASSTQTLASTASGRPASAAKVNAQKSTTTDNPLADLLQ